MSDRTVVLAEDEFSKAVYELMFTPKWMWLRRRHLRRMEQVWYRAMHHIIHVEER